MDGQAPPPPPPPPHGSNPKSTSSGLPPGNYDIFIIPPHSSGSGFFYLPSLNTQRNSFLAGVACTLLAVWIWTIIEASLKQWITAVASSGGVGMLVLIVGAGVGGWAFAKTQLEDAQNGSASGGGAKGAAGGRAGGFNQTPPNSSQEPPPQQQQAPPPPPPPQPEPPPKPKPTGTDGKTQWEKAREETRKREEERKKAEELRKKREEEQKKKEEAERSARAAAEKEKWEKMRAREKEARERDAREKIVKERLEKERKEKEAREAEAKAKMEKEIREKLEAEAKAKKAREEKAKSEARSAPTHGVGERLDPYAGSAHSSPTKGKPYEKPSARSYVGSESESGFRPYDQPKRPTNKSSASSFYSESSYQSQSTARTTPPPSQRGPYTTKSPDKIIIQAVYLFNNMFPKPVAQLVSGIGNVSDGLILKITTEGLFIDDDVRGVGQREWDVKAWTMKLVETADRNEKHILRASIRDPEGKQYVFIIDNSETWKVAIGLEKLRKGPLVRSLNHQTIPAKDVTHILSTTNWL